MADTTYVNYAAPAVNAEWLNEINDHVWHDTPVSGTTVHDASKIEYTPYDTITSTTVQAAIQEELDERKAADELKLDLDCGNLVGELPVDISGTADKATNLELLEVVAPTSPTIANSGAGVLTGTYEYAVSFVTSVGETEVGGASNSVGASSNSIQVSSIQVSSNPLVTARKLYRTKASGTTDVVQKFLVTTINDNVTTSYLDNTADGSLGVACPRINTTISHITQNGDRLAASGTSTSVFGYQAHPNNTGYANTAFGTYALTANTVGYRNTGAGVYALTSNTTGYENTAFGVHALNYTTTGNANTAIGYGAGLNITTGSGNTFVGDFAGLSNATSTSENTVIGYSALQQNVQTLGKNTVLGTRAGFNNITGYSNVFLGYQAGYRSTANNIFIVDNQDRTNEAGEQSKALLYGLFGATTGAQLLKVGGKFRSANSSVIVATSPSATQAGAEMNEVGDFITSSGASTAARNAMVFYNGNGLIGIIQTSGSTTSFTNLSDRNAKKNIVDAPSAVDKLLTLQVRSFDWKTSDEHVDYGLIAQEVYEVAPSAVCVGEGEIPWTLDASKLIPLMLKAIQEQQEEINLLKTKLYP